MNEFEKKLFKKQTKILLKIDLIKFITNHQPLAFSIIHMTKQQLIDYIENNLLEEWRKEVF
ncbi:MAG: hypothetical protein HRT99_04130 [Mycoplasmatales bacterium]|nr:hypothetical protein [Mycoplasmatales bacterium]NQZ66369.1 hypothetical protein [Mycoplasmatales bacterium]